MNLLAENRFHLWVLLLGLLILMSLYLERGELLITQITTSVSKMVLLNEISQYSYISVHD